ncbi:uncharacterized protein LOC110696247 [Chenopodium quinoa]|uniref:uncharacterized protein LOC110696247 n=1 Tax=Chenopodium quinoa TaxID=63459 RepID=UPI000B793F34|nr:uncharacterized protein LOC110696247 [Chenopodium quinoa]
MAPSKLATSSMDNLQRTKSDISSVLQHIMDQGNDDDPASTGLPTLSEVELAKCECCGMSEECSGEYIEEMRKKYSGKLICGLCAEAVKEEMEKNGGKTREKALEVHMNACVRFNRLGRAYPALYQADDVKKLLKKSNSDKAAKGGVPPRKGGLARSSSCIPAITKDMQDKLRV